jgi:hypothetical protein
VPLQSRLFQGDQALESCLVQDSAHIIVGASGDHVSKIHTALLILDEVSVAPVELKAQRYGPSTAAAVLAFKQRRHIINKSYQTAADDIVGKMTIAAMDQEMVSRESARPPLPDPRRNPAAS